MMDKFNEFYMMQNQAKKFEQGGLDDKALELYLKIVDEYLPNSDYSYDRAATLLEKKYRFDEAIKICEKAMAKIEAGDVKGDIAKFQQKINRIRLKAEHDPEFQSAAAKKALEKFHFGLPGFRTTNRLIMVAASAYYGLAAYSAYPDQLYVFLFLFSLAFVGSYGAELMMKLANNKAYTKALTVTLAALIIAAFSLAHVPMVKAIWAPEAAQQEAGEDGTKSGNGTAAASDADLAPPEIPEEYLEAAALAADKYPATFQAQMAVIDGQLFITLAVQPGSSLESIQEITEDMVRTLGGLMASEKLAGPSYGFFGEVYDYYGVTIQVIDTLEEPVAEGALPRNTNEIIWTAP